MLQKIYIFPFDKVKKENEQLGKAKENYFLKGFIQNSTVNIIYGILCTFLNQVFLNLNI